MKRNALNTILLGAAAALSVLGAACADHGPGPQPWAMRPITKDYTFPSRNAAGEVEEAGITVGAADLNKGRHLYIHYCYACHGMNGDGRGPASHGLRPAPRDFRMGKYKFDSVASGLPNDIDLARIIKGGLHGTAMLKWDIKNDELYYLIQFIKTFPKAPCNPYTDTTPECSAKLAAYPDSSLEANLGSVWEEIATSGKFKGKLKPTGEPIVPQHYDDNGNVVVDAPADPWAGKDAEAIKKGEELYHFKFECTTCHAHYLSRKALYDYKIAREPNANVTYRANMFYSLPQQNAVQDFGVATMPPDFTMNPVRSVRGPETELIDLYRVIASGVGVMPAWAQSAKPDDLWAVAHYVKSLRDLQKPENVAKRDELKQRLHSDNFVPPPPKPAEPAAAEEGAGGGDGAEKKEGEATEDKKADAKPEDKKADAKPEEKKADAKPEDKKAK